MEGNMIPLIGAFMGGGASGLLGGAASGGLFGGLFGNLMNGASGGLFGMLNNLFGGGQQQSGANEQTNQLLGDIKDMLSQLVDQKGEGGCGGSHGAGESGGCHKPTPGEGGHGCGGKPEPECGAKPHDCDGGAEEASWDGKDKSPSLDRERGAARLLEQAKNTDDPKDKRELIEMALETLGDAPSGKGLFGKIREQMDGNSYDKDIVKQAEKMLDDIDKSCLSDCAKGKAMDQIIDMLGEEGGVDGKPAGDDCSGKHGWAGGDRHDFWSVRPLPHIHTH
jgi:hypothetical protein